MRVTRARAHVVWLVVRRGTCPSRPAAARRRGFVGGVPPVTKRVGGMSTIFLALQLRDDASGRYTYLLGANMNTARAGGAPAGMGRAGGGGDGSRPVTSSLGALVLVDETGRFAAVSGPGADAPPDAIGRLAEAFVWPHGREARPGMPVPRVASFVQRDQAKAAFAENAGSGWGAMFGDGYDVAYIAPGHGMPVAMLGDGCHTMTGGAINSPVPRVICGEAVFASFAGLIFSGSLMPVLGVPRLIEFLHGPTASQQQQEQLQLQRYDDGGAAAGGAAAAAAGGGGGRPMDASPPGGPPRAAPAPAAENDDDADLFLPPRLVAIVAGGGAATGPGAAAAAAAAAVAGIPAAAAAAAHDSGAQPQMLWEGCVRSIVAFSSVTRGHVSAQRAWNPVRRAWQVRT